MSTGAIGGCSGGTPAWADVRQASQANAADAPAKDGVHGSHHGHRGHHGRGHSLVQAIRQVLEQLGMGQTQDSTASDTPAVTDTADTQAVTDTVTTTDGTTPSDAPVDAPVGGADATAGSTPSAKDVRHALHAFIHTLFQTLSQGGSATQATGGPDADGDNDGCTGASCGPRAGYKNPGTDLASLVQSGGTDAATDTTGSAAPDLTALNSAFQDLVSALGGDPSNPAVTLQAFLQGLLDHLTGTSAPAADTTTPPVGSLVTTTA